jgi:hypothetical protein
MDFSYDDEQQALRDLIRQIFSDRVSPERNRELERNGIAHDADLWAELVRANFTGLTLSEDVGGSAFGMTEVCIVLEELGRSLAPVPLFPTLVLGGMPVDEFGDDAQRERWLAPTVTDGAILTAALIESGSSDPARPRTSARLDGTDWVLDGVKECVPAAELASQILVPARAGQDSVGVFVVDPSAPGVRIERQTATNREPLGRLTLDAVRVSGECVLGDPDKGVAIVEWINERSLCALAAMQLGVCEEALRRTAEYTSSRKQFEKPIASFQGVQLRAADAYIDIEAMRSTLIEAVWLLSTGRQASLAVAVAKWWACSGGTRVTHTAQHLHGGIGSDVDYPIHRYFLWSKQMELTLGGANRQLARIGSMLVRAPANG